MKKDRPIKLTKDAYKLDVDIDIDIEHDKNETIELDGFINSRFNKSIGVDKNVLGLPEPAIKFDLIKKEKRNSNKLR